MHNELIKANINCYSIDNATLIEKKIEKLK